MRWIVAGRHIGKADLLEATCHDVWHDWLKVPLPGRLACRAPIVPGDGVGPPRRPRGNATFAAKDGPTEWRPASHAPQIADELHRKAAAEPGSAPSCLNSLRTAARRTPRHPMAGSSDCLPLPACEDMLCSSP